MLPTAPDACQGARFPLTLKAKGPSSDPPPGPPRRDHAHAVGLQSSAAAGGLAGRRLGQRLREGEHDRRHERPDRQRLRAERHRVLERPGRRRPHLLPGKALRERRRRADDRRQLLGHRDRPHVHRERRRPRKLAVLGHPGAPELERHRVGQELGGHRQLALAQPRTPPTSPSCRPPPAARSRTSRAARRSPTVSTTPPRARSWPAASLRARCRPTAPRPSR